MEELKKRIARLSSDFKEASERIHLKDDEDDLKKRSDEMMAPGFWDNQDRAKEINKWIAMIKKSIDRWVRLRDEIKELSELIALDDSTMEVEISSQLTKMEEEFEELKDELRFQGPYDDHEVVLSIYAGAGGTDAQDWAEMLLRMYTRWAEKNNLHVSTLDQSAGEEAGIKSVTIKISGGDFLYGKLSGEQGVHRLVRLSPFNSAASRETSFAKAEVLPLIERPEEIQIDDKDLKIDVFRAGGHGGQSVNTTDSAVRVTHIPTGISVAIQNERSQLQNKETALAILRSRLAALQLQQHVDDLAELKGPSKSTEFGSQDRNYVLHPYKQVKDLRTGYETSDVEGVLNGNLDDLIEAGIEA